MHIYDINLLLRNNVCEVVFTKADGSERNMACTLSDKILGPPTDTKTRLRSDDVLTVWDVEADGWRSFKASKVVSIKPID